MVSIPTGSSIERPINLDGSDEDDDSDSEEDSYDSEDDLSDFEGFPNDEPDDDNDGDATGFPGGSSSHDAGADDDEHSGGREPDDFDGGDESGKTVKPGPFESDGFKMTRKAFSKLPTSIPDVRLFSSPATAVDVLEDVGCLIPALSPTRPDIAALIKDLQRGKAVQYRPVFPVHMQNPTAWSQGHPDTDQWWAEHVRGEPVLDSLPHWLDMDESLLVNPFGSFHAKPLVFSSYPTKAPRSTPHGAYAVQYSE
jgi:hypothetical protein